VLGFAGVATISAGGLSGHISIVGILLGVGSALSWALGTVYVKKFGGGVDSIWLVTLQLIIGGVFMTGAGTITESWHSVRWEPAFIACLLFISVFVIAVGWLVFFTLIGSGEASKVASYTFLIPIVAIITGMMFLHEAFTLSLLEGLLLIVVSIYLVNRKRSASKEGAS
jgi:drug/metabolite transporter (DMT)-like permease